MRRTRRSTDREGNVTTFEYDDNHGLIEIIDPRGVSVARTVYDDDGRVIAQIDADGARIDYVHRLKKNREIITDRTGHVTALDCDDDGNVTKRIEVPQPYGEAQCVRLVRA